MKQGGDNLHDESGRGGTGRLGRKSEGLIRAASVVAAGLACALCTGVATAAELQWRSPNRYRLMLTVDPRGTAKRSHSPTAPVRINFSSLVTQRGSGRFDEHTIEVMACEASGEPYVYDADRDGYERYLLPWRIDKYYPSDEVDLVFVMPDEHHLRYTVYFDTIESGRGRPDRYPGLVGDGDLFRHQYGRREIGPSKFGDLSDFDGDGDPDLFESGVAPFIYCYENLFTQTGEHRFVERGRLTSAGQVFMPSRSPDSNRSWMTVTLNDWDHDGDQDLFPSFGDGPDIGHIVFFRNTTTPGGQTVFTRVDRMSTVSGQPLGGGPKADWFPTPTFVQDWDGDGDGRTDVIVARGGGLYLHRNLGPGGGSGFVLDDGVKLKAGGADIELLTPRVDCGDIDGDGDLDLLGITHGAAEWSTASAVHWYENTGSRRDPQLARPVLIGQMRHCYGGLKIGDFWGSDGLLDVVSGTFWKVNEKHGFPKSYGGLLKNQGPPGGPSFKLLLAGSGAMYTEQFQACDAGQQNGVRAKDLDADGDFDLISGTTDGLVLFFRNTNSNLHPVFGSVEQLMVGGPNPHPVEVKGPESGYSRLDVADWNNDGRLDLIVGDEEARVFLFPNDGRGHDPPTFLPGTQLRANGKPIDGLGRGSVLVCDLNNDGKKDLLMGMAPKSNVSSPDHDWPYQDGDNDKKDDEGFLYYKNMGSDADPVLAYPSWLRAGGKIISYTRPNLGSFVDWDNDGRKDFVGCHFEGNIRFYRNTGSGQPNTEPQLSPAEGTVIVEDFCTTQMISGADAVDWRGDGDVDILTGQGHGGSGLRFYERDYINDFVNKTVHGNDTFPVVKVGVVETSKASGDHDGQPERR